MILRIGSFQMVDQPEVKEGDVVTKPKMMGFKNYVSGAVFQITGKIDQILLQNFNLKRADTGMDLQ